MQIRGKITNILQVVQIKVYYFAHNPPYCAQSAFFVQFSYFVQTVIGYIL